METHCKTTGNLFQDFTPKMSDDTLTASIKNSIHGKEVYKPGCISTRYVVNQEKSVTYISFVLSRLWHFPFTGTNIRDKLMNFRLGFCQEGGQTWWTRELPSGRLGQISRTSVEDDLVLSFDTIGLPQEMLTTALSCPSFVYHPCIYVVHFRESFLELLKSLTTLSCTIGNLHFCHFMCSLSLTFPPHSSVYVLWSFYIHLTKSNLLPVNMVGDGVF